MIHAGVELGGTKCVAVLARGADDVLARETIPTTSPDETLGLIERTLIGWKQEHDFRSLGIASFGPIDIEPASPTFGHIAATPKPGWAGTDVANRLEQAVGVPTAFDSDVVGAALAEMRWGCGRRLDDFAYVTVGTGIGVGLILGGKAARGFANCELGHIRVARADGDDWPGSCPFHGDCVEGLASGTALKARFGDDAVRLAAGHPVWDEVAGTLAQLCHAIVCAASPRRIAIGGGVVSGQPHLLDRIQTKLADSLNCYIELPGDGSYVRAPALGDDAGPLGAIALAKTVTR